MTFMVQFSDAIAVLKANQGFTPNKYEDSFYRVYNTDKGIIQVRVSNHGTELWTWIKNAPIDPSDCIANICIVLSDDGTHKSNTTVDMNLYKKDKNGKNLLGNDGRRIVSGKRDSFCIKQYVYDLSILTTRNIAIINDRISKIPNHKKFCDPLQTNPSKHSQVYMLYPNQPEQSLGLNNGITTTPQVAADTNKTADEKSPVLERRNAIKITETDIRMMVNEAINRLRSH
jgi:hypothetical protein